MTGKGIVIIGGGPAGIATAIQLKRYGLDAVVLEKRKIGGLLRSANLVENYPGFPDGISGPALVKLFEKQLEASSIEVWYEEVSEVCWENERFAVRTNERTLYPKVVVVASGTYPVELADLEVPPQWQVAVINDIDSILGERGKRMIIVGAGDAAFDYALNLGRANEVTIVNRGATVSCIPLLWQRARECAAISYLPNTTVLRIAGKSSDQYEFECRRNGEIVSLSAHYLISAIGRKPQLRFLADGQQAIFDQLEQDSLIYFVGDVKNWSFRQTAIAVGDGIRVAMEIQARLSIPQREVVIQEMKIRASTDSKGIATVYIAEFGDGRFVEMVESIQPPLPREKKWVLIISTLFGCPVGCPMCDAGGGYRGKLSKAEMFEQIDFLVRKRLPRRGHSGREVQDSICENGGAGAELECARCPRGIACQMPGAGFDSLHFHGCSKRHGRFL